jgi:YVTN family beta-propeller protein
MVHCRTGPAGGVGRHDPRRAAAAARASTRKLPMKMHRSAPLASLAAVLALACHGAALAQGAGVAYVSNQQGGVSVIDLATLAVTANLDIAAHGPRGIGLSDDGKRLVTANMGNENISVIDTASGKVVRQVTIGRNPEFVRVRGQLAYITYEPRSAGGPAGAAAPAKPDDDDDAPGHIAIVDLASGQAIRDIVGKPQTEGVEFSRDGSQLIVTNESDNSLSVLDAASGKLLRTVALAAYGDRPRGVKRSPDGRTYVVTLELSGKLLVLNEQLELVRQLPTARTPYGVAFDRAGSRVFVAANKDKLLQVFDTATWEKIKDVPIGDRCWHFSFTPDDRRILVACGKSNEVVVIDARSLEVTGHIAGLNMPWGIVTFPRSMGSID